MPAPPLWKDHRCFVCWALCTDLECLPEYLEINEGRPWPTRIPSGWYVLLFEPCNHTVRFQFNTVQALGVNKLLDAMKERCLC